MDSIFDYRVPQRGREKHYLVPEPVIGAAERIYRARDACAEVELGEIDRILLTMLAPWTRGALLHEPYMLRRIAWAACAVAGNIVTPPEESIVKRTGKWCVSVQHDAPKCALRITMVQVADERHVESASDIHDLVSYLLADCERVYAKVIDAIYCTGLPRHAATVTRMHILRCDALHALSSAADHYKKGDKYDRE